MSCSKTWMSCFKDRRGEGKFFITNIFTILDEASGGILIALGEWSAMDWYLDAQQVPLAGLRLKWSY